MTKYNWCVAIVIATWFGTSLMQAREPETLDEGNLQDRIRALGAERNEAQQLRRAVELAARHRLSSLQVKAIAARLNDDGARLEFAMAAYPLTVDPENYYEVYDAFKTFSKVLRLHDWIRERARPPGSPVVVVPEVVSDEEARGIVQAIRKESFDQTKDKLARQILSSSRKKFLSAQIKAILKCFAFEATRLEFAKFAYDYTLDREQYFQVNDALEFAASRESLSQYIRTRNQPPPPRPH